MPHLMTAFAASLVASCSTTIALYPYRDFVKHFSSSSPTVNLHSTFAVSRWRGMLTNPSQPLLLSSPWVALLTLHSVSAGGLPGALIAGMGFASMKVFMNTVGRRMSATRNRHGDLLYPSLGAALTKSTAQYGLWSWFAGWTATAMIATLWHGAALSSLRGTRWRKTSWIEDAWYGFRMSSFFMFISTPVRNSFRSALYSVERSGGVHSFSSWVQGEKAIFQEAAGVARSTFHLGLSFWFGGSFQTMFKTCLPFGIMYANYRLLVGMLR